MKYYGEDGNLKRKELAKIIYSNDEKRQLLNSCTFKYITKEIKQQIRNSRNNLIIIDAPLLFESKINEMCSKVIGIISEKNLQIERIVKRDNIQHDEADNRIKAQNINSFYLQNCDDIIVNNTDIFELQKCVDKLAEKYNITK